MALDFIRIAEISSKNSIVISPEFIVKRSKDLMIRGGAFYAIWDEHRQIWSTDEDDIWRLIDQEVRDYQNDHYPNGAVGLKLLSDFSSKKWSEWQQYVKALPDNYVELDCDITFQKDDPKKEDYRSKCLGYPIGDGDISNYEELVKTIYDPEELEKLEWSVGSIISGDSKRLQKFIVLYGGPGTGKSTYLNIVNMLFDGYVSTFEAKALGSNSASFAMEPFRNNPLVAIQHDGDLSRIEDNTRLNSITSHETMIMNEKYKSSYPIKLHTFLFMGTNKPVKITDAKSGIIRRLIDVRPSGFTVDKHRYDILMDNIRYELGAIAQHCLDVYMDLGFHHYDGYRSIEMIGATNDIYNFIEDNWDLFSDIDEDGIVLKVMWKRYKEYCEDSGNSYPLNMRAFKFEMKNYFAEYYERIENRTSIYKHFLKEKFDYQPLEKSKEQVDHWLIFNNDDSILDARLADCPAQLAKDNKPSMKWDDVTTKLRDIDTTKIHYVRPPERLIVIDFDLKDEEGNKNFELNLKEAEKWPKTYAELSKSEAGIHLHYWYDGDISELSHYFDDNPDIEIKVFTGKASLRRMFTKCNDYPITKITSGLPKREVKKMVKMDVLKSEKELRRMIEKNLRKEIHHATKPSMDFIKHLLDEAYESGLTYDVSDMLPDIQVFAMGSTNQSDYCVKLINRMHLKSDNERENSEEADGEMIFFDCEVFPNLFIICWKKHHDKTGCVRMINPTPEEVEELFKMKLIGFNNRPYDNHILYARSMGYTNQELSRLSRRIINEKDQKAKFLEAYNISYTDVYDFLAPQNKMGLKKWEIKLHIKHKECPYKWDQDVPEDKWDEVADYCCNDVEATEAVFDANPEDWMARQILAEWAGMTVNDTTNSLTTRIIVGKDPHPQNKFVYTDLSTIFPGYRYDPFGIPDEEYNENAKIVQGKSIFMGEDPSEGGRVYAKPGFYINVGVLDIGSMHPHSAKELNLFGPYTKNYTDIMDGRMCIKHSDYEAAKEFLPEKLWHYLEEGSEAKKLGGAMKGAINPVYGLTSAKFDNKLKDPRNKDNIVAKRGALFMIHLQKLVENEGYTVVHVKTDSIKIANMDHYILNLVMEEGKKYGYPFEWEHTYSKMCLVNESTYIAEVSEEDGKPCERYWTATGKQFQVPYVFKKLFSHEPIEFWDLCETKSVSTAMYLDMNEKLPEGDHNYIFVGKVGNFVPILPGKGGGVLLRESGDDYHAVEGTKKKGTKDEVYRWLEDEVVMNLDEKDDIIDYGYFNQLCDDAIDKINEFCDFERFVSDDEFIYNEDPVEEELPFKEVS